MDAKLKAKAMTDDQLDNVAGGTYDQSWEVALMLKKAGVEGTLNGLGGVNFDSVHCRRVVNFRQRIFGDVAGFELRIVKQGARINVAAVRNADLSFTDTAF